MHSIPENSRSRQIYPAPQWLADTLTIKNSSCLSPRSAANLILSATVSNRCSRSAENGHKRLERPPYLWFDFDPCADVRRGARGTNQFQPASQGVSLAAEAAAVLPGLQPERGAVGDCERLRARKGSIRFVQRRRVGQDRTSFGARDGDSGVCEIG